MRKTSVTHAHATKLRNQVHVWTVHQLSTVEEEKNSDIWFTKLHKENPVSSLLVLANICCRLHSIFIASMYSDRLLPWKPLRDTCRSFPLFTDSYEKKKASDVRGPTVYLFFFSSSTSFLC